MAPKIHKWGKGHWASDAPDIIVVRGIDGSTTEDVFVGAGATYYVLAENGEFDVGGKKVGIYSIHGSGEVRWQVMQWELDSELRHEAELFRAGNGEAKFDPKDTRYQALLAARHFGIVPERSGTYRKWLREGDEGSFLVWLDIQRERNATVAEIVSDAEIEIGRLQWLIYKPGGSGVYWSVPDDARPAGEVVERHRWSLFWIFLSSPGDEGIGVDWLMHQLAGFQVDAKPYEAGVAWERLSGVFNDFHAMVEDRASGGPPEGFSQAAYPIQEALLRLVAMSIEDDVRHLKLDGKRVMPPYDPDLWEEHLQGLGQKLYESDRLLKHLRWPPRFIKFFRRLLDMME